MVKQMIHTGIFGVNTYIVPISEKQVFVVDPAACEYCGDQDKIINYLEQNNLTCEAVLLTHCHFDHITGILPIVEKFPNTKIAASEIDAPEIGYGKINQFALQNMGLLSLAETLEKQPAPNLLLDDGDDFYGWKVLLTPGHTKGSICLYNEKENELISGDTVFFNGYGRTDLPGGNEKEMMESLSRLEKILQKGADLFPGH